MSWSLEALIEATEGVLAGELLGNEPVVFDSISTDTRTLKSGALYIAIKGEHFNGHDFIAEAVKQGAVAVLISEPVDTIVPAVLVEDTRLALGMFAAWHRQKMPLKKLIAVTGSNGKTTCKNMIRHLLSKEARVLATEGNLNNDFGVPRTLLEITEEDEYAVIEMGANHSGEIDYLSRLAQPDVAVITLAAGAHLEGFGSLEGVIRTKGEILVGLTPNEGVMVLNTGSPGYDYWLEQCQKRALRLITFGVNQAAQLSYHHFRQQQDGIVFEVHYRESTSDSVKTATATLPVLGEHNALNALAAMAAVMAAGIEFEALPPRLADFSGVTGRLQQVSLPNGLLIDDSYNANPDSMKAALRTLTSLAGESLACLGAMAELGETAEQAHEDVAHYARQQGVRYLLVYGEAAKPMISAFGEGAYWFDNHQALAERAVALIQEQGINHCLVKGSRSSKMETVANLIQQQLLS